MHITLDHIKSSDEIRTYITQADLSLTARGYTEHSFPHVSRCAAIAGDILTSLHFPRREVELAQMYRLAGDHQTYGELLLRATSTMEELALPDQAQHARNR